MTKKLTIALIVLIVIGLGAYLVLHQNKTYKSTTSNTSSSATSGSSTQAAATITYDGSGFSPATTTVKSGDTVAIKNTSSSDMQLDSNPHPVHTDDTDLNVGMVGAGQTVTFKVTKKGSFGFHNHLNPSQTAKIVIE